MIGERGREKEGEIGRRAGHLIRGDRGGDRWETGILGFDWPFGGAWAKGKDKEVDDRENRWVAEDNRIEEKVIILNMPISHMLYIYMIK